MADVATGEGLAQTEDVRQHQVRHEPVARAAKARGHLVKDQQHVVLIAQLPGPLQKRHVVHQHPAGALEQRLHDEAGQPVAGLRKCTLQRRDLRGDVDDALLLPEGEVVVLVVAHLHGLEGVAVVGVGQGQHRVPFAAPVGVEL